MSSNRWLREGAVSAIGKYLDRNFKPINILVFRNGDMFDKGFEISVTRRQFPNWLTLLDHLTEKLRLSDGAVHSVYTTLGAEVRTFQELDNGQWYVGAHGKFRPVSYGANVPRQWKAAMINDIRKYPTGLSSKESLEMYLRRRGYKPVIGDVWDDSQFDTTKQHMHSYNGRLTRQIRRNPARTRSADGASGRRSRVANGPRSKTEESIRSGRPTATLIMRKAQSLPSGTRLPNFPANVRHTSISQRTGRPGTATLSSRSGNPRSLASEATRRTMQWDPTTTTSAIQPKFLTLQVEASNLYKPVDSKVKKLYEDRAYRFYERQKQLELKRELLEKVAKRTAENMDKSSGTNCGRCIYDMYSRKSYTPSLLPANRHMLHAQTSINPLPYRLPPAQLGHSLNSYTSSNSYSANRLRVPQLRIGATQKNVMRGNIDKSPRWVQELSTAVEHLSPEASTLSRSKQPRSRLK